MWRGHSAQALEGSLGDLAVTAGESEPNGIGGFHGTIEDERVWAPRQEGNRRREEAY